MKRYELAKRQGLNWQVVLIQDCETDIKVLTLECVRRGENYGEVNKKVMSLIQETVNALESPTLKELTKRTLTQFASRIYLKWLTVFGTNALGIAVIATLNAKGVNVPQKVATVLKNLPDKIYNRASPNATYHNEYERSVINRINSIMDEHAKEDYSDRYTLRAVAERQIRQEWHEKQLSDFKKRGVNLVWIDTHANCSKRCQSWQGGLYSLDRTSGVIDGINYQPLENATDIYTYTKGGNAYKNGCISGFNCRHKLIACRKNFKPETIPESVLVRQRVLEEEQRYMERMVRKYESRALGYRKEVNKVLYKHNKALVKKWTDRYVEFSKKNDIPIYPSRLDV